MCYFVTFILQVFNYDFKMLGDKRIHKETYWFIPGAFNKRKQKMNCILTLYVYQKTNRFVGVRPLTYTYGTSLSDTKGMSLNNKGKGMSLNNNQLSKQLKDEEKNKRHGLPLFISNGQKLFFVSQLLYIVFNLQKTG